MALTNTAKKLKGALSNLLDIEDVDVDTAPYAVLVGNVGAGKSTIVEKLTGETGRSSDGESSFTKTMDYLWTADKSLMIADTPGTNPRKEKLEHNMEIAAALNYQAVSRFLIVVKAELRLDDSLSSVQEYAERFVALPMGCLGVVVTHMDRELKWSEREFTEACIEDLDISDVVFTGTNTTGEDLCQQIVSKCHGKKHKIDINSELFFRMFKINQSRVKILKVTDEFVNLFKRAKKDFDKLRAELTESDTEKADLFFEFKNFMEQEVDKAKEKVSKKLGFDFLGPEALIQAGYIANMTNQIRAIIFDLRMEGLTLLTNVGDNDLRKCPQCNRVWAKVEGCDGTTTCGNPPSGSFRFDLRSQSVFATFTFTFSGDGRLSISKSGQRSLSAQVTQSNQFDGCGARINWSTMKRIPDSEIPEDFRVVPKKVSTDDILSLPRRARTVYDYVDRYLGTGHKKFTSKNF
ncbi:uncharacterized protein [Clytia hemisphaerica]|uniref:G domain-containing protein n=1 Tax=Clytia hemisphaerica TaxID=252671 RepID=A0A7M5U2S2_9CNID|eukprot:TCONS_00025203-protein